MRPLAAFVALLGTVIGMRMGRLVVPTRAVRGMPVVPLARAILVMPECHALPRDDGRHTLDRNGEGQQRDSEKADKGSRHRSALYASCFEPHPRRRFRHPAHFLRRRIPRSSAAMRARPVGAENRHDGNQRKQHGKNESDDFCPLRRACRASAGFIP